ALANTTSRRSQEVINQAKYSAVEALENTAVRQKELSLNFGQKLASLTLASAKGVGLVSETGEKKLAQLENTISQTNQSIQQTGQETVQSVQEYNNNGQKYLATEVGRSLWSLGDMYNRFMDFIIPDSLKNKYAVLYEVPASPQTIIEKETIVKETTVVREEAASAANNQGLLRRLDASRNDSGAVVPVSPNLSITGNADIGGYLNVSGPTTLKNKLTVLGASEFLGDMIVNAALTAKTLLVTEVSQFNGTINAADIVANNLTSRGGLTVVGNSYIGGNELIQGNLKVAGTFSAGHTEFPSLGIHGPMGAQSVSAGSGGLMVSGSSYLSGEVYVKNILDIDVDSGSALTVGDGSNDTCTVDTNGDVVTIAGTLNLNGNMQLNGDLDLNGALDLDVASTSALAVGDGTIDNLNI
ncbi:MAG: hypothetical protein Q8O93_00005, partial [bacterium]|nr:hypothetical protein [bacterium]